MNCPRCNKPLEPGHSFCTNCGLKVGAYNPTPQPNPPSPQPNPPSPKGSGKKVVLGCLGAFVGAVILVIIIIVILLNTVLDSARTSTSSTSGNTSGNTSSSSSSGNTSTGGEPAPQPMPVPDITDTINVYIENHSNHSDVAVAVMDCNSGTKYTSYSADDLYSSWGFYLPVYMAYVSEYSSLPTDILSSDPAVCNGAANRAMDAMGGLDRVNSILRNNYSCTRTSFGRRFGESNKYNDNYTSASEAVELLYSMSSTSNYRLLSYNPSSFGISYPYGTNVYSQIGTENRGVKKNLNVFAIVEGNNSRYCVVVLTKNSASMGGSLISEMLNTIHEDMESLGAQ